MTVNIVAFILTAFVCFVLPVIILGIVLKKNPMERGAVLGCFVLGLLFYITMQWGIREHAFKYIIENTSWGEWRNLHYGVYLFINALVSTIFVMIPFYIATLCIFKKQVSYAKAVSWGLGYSMAEAIMPVGYQSVLAIISSVREKTEVLVVSSAELYLAAFERVLFIVIYVAIVVGLVYFIQQKMYVRGVLIVGFCLLVINFLPNFFITLSTVAFAETLDRSVSLILTYVVLTMTAITGITVLSALKYSMQDSHIDSKQAVKAYQKKVEEKKNAKEQKKKK